MQARFELWSLTFELLNFGRSRSLLLAGLKIRSGSFQMVTHVESVTVLFAFFILNYVLISDRGFVKNHGKSSLAVVRGHSGCSSKTLAVRVTLSLG